MIKYMTSACCFLTLVADPLFGQTPANDSGASSTAALGVPIALAEIAEPAPAAPSLLPPAPLEPLAPLPAPIILTGTLPNRGPIGEVIELAGFDRTEIVTSTCSFDSQRERWFDNVSLFAGLDGSKQPVDLGVNANFGYRLAANMGLPLIEEAGLGLQIGTSLNYSRSEMRVLHFLDGTVDHTQCFSTIGLFQHSDTGLSWGIAYDFRFDDYYDRFDTTQWRAQVGLPVSPDDDVGIWGTLRDRGDKATLGPLLPLTVRPLNQVNFYWRHVWPSEATTRLWVGVTADHGRFSLLFPGEPNVRHPFCFGGDLLIPLNDSLAIFGEAQFITPNDSGTVCATLGIAWYPGAARQAARNRFSPYQNVANNTTMPLDLRR